MKSIQENRMMHKWRSHIVARRCRWPARRSLRWRRTLIQSITSSQQAGTEVVRIELSEPLTAVPAGFTVQAPPRVAIDLPGVSNGAGQARRSRSTRATCARSTSRRPASARAWC